MAEINTVGDAEIAVRHVVQEVMTPRPGDRVLGSFMVGKINRKGKKDPRVLLVLESGIELHYPTGKLQDLARHQRVMSWFDIKSVRHDEKEVDLNGTKKTTRMHFSVAMFITGRYTVRQIFDVILTQMTAVLLESEMPTFTPLVTLPSGDVCLWRPLTRFRARCLMAGKCPADGVCNVFKVLIASHSGVFDAEPIGLSAHCIDEFLMGLAACPVKSLTLKQGQVVDGKSRWDAMAKFMATQAHLETLTTAEPVPMTELHLPAVSPVFRMLNLTIHVWNQKSVRVICQAVTRAGIPGLGVTAMEWGFIDQILKEFPPLRQFLIRDCSLERVPDIPRLCALPLESLSLINCRVPILTLLPQLDIPEVDLSGNAAGKMSSELRLRPGLKRLVLDDCTWHREGMRALIQGIVATGTLMELSLCRHGLKQGPVDRVFQDLGTAPCRLRKFYWDGNIIAPEFFTFLGLCTELEELTLNAVPWDKRGGALRKFVQFINGNRTIRVLRIRGGVFQQIPPDKISTLLNTFKKFNRTVATLDLSGNLINEQALSSLTWVLTSNPYVNEILVDGCFGADHWELFGRLLETAERTKRPLTISFPTSELTNWSLNHVEHGRVWERLENLRTKVYVEDEDQKDEVPLYPTRDEFDGEGIPRVTLPPDGELLKSFQEEYSLAAMQARGQGWN